MREMDVTYSEHHKDAAQHFTELCWRYGMPVPAISPAGPSGAEYAVSKAVVIAADPTLSAERHAQILFGHYLCALYTTVYHRDEVARLLVDLLRKDMLATPAAPPASSTPGEDPDECPDCGGPAVKRCRCMIGDRRCAKGHEWHFCHIHKKRIRGNGHGSGQPFGCKCPGGQHGTGHRG